MTILSSDTTSARRPMMAWAAMAARATGRTVAAAARRIAASRAHRKAERALMAFDDHGLKDIGIHRGEIHSAVRSERPQPHR